MVRYYFYLYFYILQLYTIIISVARMAKNLPNLIPQAFSYLFSGDDCRFNRIIGVVDDVSLEIYVWMEWCCNFYFSKFYTGSHVSDVISVMSSSIFVSGNHQI